MHIILRQQNANKSISKNNCNFYLLSINKSRLMCLNPTVKNSKIGQKNENRMMV